MSGQDAAPQNKAVLLLAFAIVLSLGGLAGFFILFAKDFNIYWLILSPVILAVYQIPAVFFFWLYKRRRPPRIENPDPEKGTPGRDPL